MKPTDDVAIKTGWDMIAAVLAVGTFGGIVALYILTPIFVVGLCFYGLFHLFGWL